MQPSVALTACIGLLLAYLTGIYVTGSLHGASRWMGAMLACTSAVVVLQSPGYKEALHAGWIRVLGTFLGALIAYAYLSVWNFSIIGMLASVFVLEMLSMMLGIYKNDRISTITLLIILLISQMTPHITPLENCLLRFCESATGVGVGLGMLWLLDRWDRWRHAPEKADIEHGKTVDMDSMPLRWGHFRVVIVASLGQITGAGLSTLVGVVLPMIQLVRHPELNSWQQGAIAATSLAGITIGSLFFGARSDRKGYLFFFRLCPALILAAALLACAVDNLAGLVAGLFIMGLGIGGGYSLDSDYISELMPRRWKLFMVGVAKAASSIGNIVVAGCCFLLLRSWDDPHMWNRLLLLIAVLATIMLLCRIRFDESPGWLAAKGRAAEAQRAVHFFLGNDVETGNLRGQSGNEKRPKVSWRALVSRKHIRRVVFSGLPWACEGLGVYGIGVFLPVLLMALGLGNETGSALGKITDSVRLTTLINLLILPGFIIGLALVNRWSHVKTQTWGFILCAAGLALLLGSCELHGPAWLSIAGFMLFELFLNAGPHLLTFVIPPQIYSIAERGAGTGIAAACGKMGAMAGVLLVPLLLKWGGAGLVLGVTIAVQLLGAAITAILGREILPDRAPGVRPQIRRD